MPGVKRLADYCVALFAPPDGGLVGGIAACSGGVVECLASRDDVA